MGLKLRLELALWQVSMELTLFNMGDSHIYKLFGAIPSNEGRVSLVLLMSNP